MQFQLTSQVLEVCVLSVLSREDTYGYKLTQGIKTILSVSESTLYPVLRRLQTDGSLFTYDEAFDGRNRRYYKLTDSGSVKLAEYLTLWEQHKNKVDRIVKEGLN